MKRVSGYLSVFLMLVVILSSCCDSSLMYSTGRDTAKSFGNGRYQIIRNRTRRGDYVKYSLYDCEFHDCIISDVFGYVEQDNSVYLNGYHWGKDTYGTKYIVIDVNNNDIIEVNNLNELTVDESSIFNNIHRFVSSFEDSHYINKFEKLDIKYSVGADTMELFCNGKYQIIYGCLINNYSSFLYDVQNNTIILDGFFGYCEKDDKYYMWGIDSNDNYSPKYIIIDKDDNEIIEEKKQEDLNNTERFIFESIKKY